MIPRGLRLLIAVAFVAGCAREPEKPLLLRLRLDRASGPAAEAVGYVLEIKNISRKTIDIRERMPSTDCLFDCEPSPFSGYIRPGTSIEFSGPEGAASALLIPLVRWDGAPEFWIDDCGGGQPCKQYYPGWVIKLGSGRTLTTAPMPRLSSGPRPRIPDGFRELYPLIFRPGKYRLKAIYKSPKGLRFESDPVEYEALPSPKAERLMRQSKRDHELRRRKINKLFNALVE